MSTFYNYDRCDRACIYTMSCQLEIGMHSTVFSLSVHTWCGNGRKSFGISPALFCFHWSTVELFSPSNPKWFLEPVSRFEKNHSYIRYFSWYFWSFDLYYLTRWAIEPEMAPLGDVAHPHNNLVHPSLAVNVWTETKYNIATINLLNQFLPLNKIRLPKRNSRMLRPLIAKKQNRLFWKGKLPITCDWYSFFKFQ